MDGVSAKFIRSGCSFIASPITHILNLSLSQSTVPKAFKEARVVPLYKKGGRGEVGNYRPVSILPVVSKTFERIVYDQLSKHLDKHDILYKYQSCFSHVSTETALIDLSDRIKFSMDKRGEELTKLNVWLIDNKLSLHLGKTESILFASDRKLKQHEFLRISCNGTKVGGKEVVTYLGGQLDQDLSGKSMAQKIIHKANASLRFLYRNKIFLNQYCRKTVCMAKIQSRIDYAKQFLLPRSTKIPTESPSGRTK